MGRGMHPLDSSEAVDAVLDFTLVVERAIRDNVVTLDERRAIKESQRAAIALVQRTDGNIRAAMSVLRTGRIVPGLRRHHGEFLPDGVDESGDAA